VSGARLNVKEEQIQRVDTDGLVSTEERIIIIRGKSESVQQAEMLIRKIVADQPIITQETIYVPEESVGRIIGKRFYYYNLFI
jgi:tudor domain-containing protein 2